MAAGDGSAATVLGAVGGLTPLISTLTFGLGPGFAFGFAGVLDLSDPLEG